MIKKYIFLLAFLSLVIIKTPQKALSIEMSDKLFDLLEPDLQQYIKNWDIQNTVINLYNHINNNQMMLEMVVGDYLEKGTEKWTETFFDEISKKNVTVKHPAVTGAEYRKHLNIPAEVWNDPVQKKRLKLFWKTAMIHHDAAKANTTKKFIDQQIKKLESTFLAEHPEFKGDHSKFLKRLKSEFLKRLRSKKLAVHLSEVKSLKNKLVVEGIHEFYHKNPFASTEGKEFIALFNKVDKGVIKDIASLKILKKLFPSVTDLSWIQESTNALEHMVDAQDRASANASIVELGRTTTSNARYNFKGGEATLIEKCDKKCHLLSILERDYKKVTNTYHQYHQQVQKIFKEFKKIGINTDLLDPIQKFQLIPLVLDGERDLSKFDVKKMKRILFGSGHQNVLEMVAKEKENVLAKYEKKRKRYILLEDIKRLIRPDLKSLERDPILERDVKKLIKKYSAAELLEAIPPENHQKRRELARMIKKHGGERKINSFILANMAEILQGGSLICPL